MIKTAALILGIIVGTATVASAADYVSQPRRPAVQKRYYDETFPRATRYLGIKRWGFRVEPHPEDRPLLFFAAHRYYERLGAPARY